VVRKVCEVSLLGGFSVRVDGQAVPAESWRRRRAAELVKLLAVAETHRLHREQLMDAMWPQLTVEAAGSNLRKAVHFARKALGADDVIGVSGQVVELFPDADVVVDAHEFERSAVMVLKSGTPEDAAQVAAGYSGELLPEDRYQEWSYEFRRRLRSLALRLVKKAEMWDRALEFDPADEESHRALMTEALDAGDRTAAIRQFERLRKRLRIDLGMSPDQESVALYERALAGDTRSLSVAELARQSLARGAVLLNTGDLDGAEQLGLQAQRLALDNELGEELGQASALLSIVANLRGRWRSAFRSEFAEAVRQSNQTASQIFDGHLCVTEFHLQGPNGHEGIVEFAEQLLETARSSGSVHGEAVAEMLTGEANLFAGDVPRAEEHLRKALSNYRDAGAIPGQVVTLQRLAECELDRGDNRAARQLLEEGLDLARTSPMAPHLMVRMHEGLVAAADPSAAAAQIEASEADLEGTVICPPCSVGLRLATIKALARSGGVALAERRLDEVEPIVDMWPDGPWHAALVESRGEIARARGDEEEARTLFKGATENYEQLHRPRDASRCRALVDVSS